MLCNLCKGAGSLIALWPLEWWRCPKCTGHGATVQFGPALFRTPNPHQEGR